MSELPSNYHQDINLKPLLDRDNEIDLRELFSVIWGGKWLISSITAVCSVVAVAVALYLPNIYKSEALLAPASSEQSGGLASQFGGLASMVGINLVGGGGTDKTTLAIEVMKSREFIGQFVKQHNLLVPLIAAKGWDSNRKSLIIDDELYDTDSGTWVRKPTPPRGAEPSMQEAYEAFQESFKVRQDKESGLVTVSVQHYSPVVAQQWVEWLVQAINQEMKKRDLFEAHRSIAYLESKLAQTRVADMQSVLYQLIEEQTKTVMFAEVREEYVFKTVDPAVVPELKVKPKRALICVLGSLLGAILGLALVLVRFAFRKDQALDSSIVSGAEN